MATFNAEVDIENLRIIITCDTFWSCTCDGNVKLSKFSGVGDDEIKLLSDGYAWLYNGNVQFSYGDERCDYPVIQVAYNDFCTLNTTPSYMICADGDDSTKNVIYFRYNTTNDTFLLSINETVGRWELEDSGSHIYFVEGNEVMIVANNDNEFIIKPTDCTDETKYVHIIPVKND